MPDPITLTVNGEEVTVAVDPETPLLSVLRNDLGLLGARFGCGLGLCGACNVHVDGTVVPSCDTPIWSAAGRSVVTIEGVSDGDRLHPVQSALLETQAAQCGFCISGIVMSACALLEQNPAPDEAEVTEALEKNLCRCGVQRRVIEAVVQAGRDS